MNLVSKIAKFATAVISKIELPPKQESSNADIVLAISSIQEEFARTIATTIELNAKTIEAVRKVVTTQNDIFREFMTKNQRVFDALKEYFDEERRGIILQRAKMEEQRPTPDDLRF